MMWQPSSPNWHVKVTSLLRGCHLFVTPQCNDERKQQDQQNERLTKIMKDQKLLVDLVKHPHCCGNGCGDVDSSYPYHLCQSTKPRVAGNLKP
jgi:hypothetical protein